MKALRDKVLVMIVGPSSIGKSTLMHRVAEIDSDFSYVQSFTTRPARLGEKTSYNFIDQPAAHQILNQRSAVTYFQHPTAGHIYGTTIDSYVGKFNLLDTLSNSVKSYRNLPFKDSVTISVTAPPEQWRRWFLSRFPEPSAEAQQRLDEATQSIKWSLADNQTQWIVNLDGRQAEAAIKLIAMANGQQESIDAPSDAHAILDLIERGEIWPNQ